jgi:hypothetical protein
MRMPGKPGMPHKGNLRIILFRHNEGMGQKAKKKARKR